MSTNTPMNFDELKNWAMINRKGLVVGAILGLVISRLLK